ncbi:MAG TPA: hypothetical protein VKA26_10445 [Ignavibacteriaceae bacterium]|nr:hypothetical protein [Ignavibacteriaceae bacterium]
MAKIYIGLHGRYEIYSSGSIIFRKSNDKGETNGETMVFKNVQSIPFRQDRWRIAQILTGKRDDQHESKFMF